MHQGSKSLSDKGKEEDRSASAPSSFRSAVDEGEWGVGCRVKLLYDYVSRAPTELEGKGGDVFVVLKEEVKGWVLVRREKEGKVGYLPRSYLVCVQSAMDVGGPKGARTQVLVRREKEGRGRSRRCYW